jgi:AcrR family transcriptional regulator
VSRVDVRGIRRLQILDAAQRLVAERGWNGTTFADICREAGVSNGVLTYHFRDKEDLRLALFERELERWRVYFGAMAGKDVSPARHAAGAVKGASARIESDPEFFRTLFSYLCCDAPGRPEMAARVSEFFAEMRGGIEAHFAHNAARGELGGRDPKDAASIFQTVLLGYAFGRIMLGIEPLKEDLIDLLAGYLTGTRSAAPDDSNEG